MNEKFTITVLIFLNSLAHANTESKADKWTPELSIDRFDIVHAKVSPDGSQTWIQYNELDQNLNYKSRCSLISNSSKRTIFTTPFDIDCHGGSWSPDSKSIVFISSKDQTDFIYRTSSDRFSYEEIYATKGSISYPQWSLDGKKLAFLLAKSTIYKSIEVDWNEIPEPNRLFIMDLDSDGNPTHKPYSITPGSFPVGTEVGRRGLFLWSPDSKQIAFSYAPQNFVGSYKDSKIAIVDIENGKIKDLSELGTLFDPVFSPNGKFLAFVGDNSLNTGDGFKSNDLFLTDLRVCLLNVSSNEKTCLAKTPNESPSIIGWSQDGKDIYIQELLRSTNVLYSLPLNGEKPTLLQSEAFSTIRAPSVNMTGTYLGFVAESLYMPPEAFITSLDAFQPKKISDFHKELLKLPNIKTEIIKWTSSDGLEIEGLLIYPPTYKEGQRVPLIVAVHGGPIRPWKQEFLGNAIGCPFSFAVLASEGYAIFAPNVRGSDGYGVAFRQANFRDFGGGDYEDIMSGVDYLVARGIADTEKLAIWGWSYGGYMAAWAATQTTRFKAAIVGAGIVDFLSFPGKSISNTYIGSYFGKTLWDDPIYRFNISPLKYIDNVNTPILIQHGADDWNVPIQQSYTLYETLLAKNIPVKFLIYRKQAHVFDLEAIIVGMKSMLTWLEKYIAPDNNR